jgi:hypothetical protein
MYIEKRYTVIFTYMFGLYSAEHFYNKKGAH